MISIHLVSRIVIYILLLDKKFPLNSFIRSDDLAKSSTLNRIIHLSCSSSRDIFDNFFRKVKLASDTSFFREKQPDLPKLLTTEKKVLKKYSSMLITASSMSSYYLSMLLEIKKKAVNLIDFLKKKYRME